MFENPTAWERRPKQEKVPLTILGREMLTAQKNQDFQRREFLTEQLRKSNPLAKSFISKFGGTDDNFMAGIIEDYERDTKQEKKDALTRSKEMLLITVRSKMVNKILYSSSSSSDSFISSANIF